MKKNRTIKGTNKTSANESEWITCQLSQPCEAKYLVIVVDRGQASEVNYFDSLEEAKRAFGEIAYDHGYEPEEINGSDRYAVSIWEWTKDRYEKVVFL